MGTVAYFAGLTDANSWPYLFWSGIGGDIGKLTVLVALIHLIWIHRKHVKAHMPKDGDKED